MMGPAEKPTGATDTWSLLIFGVNVIACLVIPIFGFVTCDPFKYGKIFSTKRNLHSIDKNTIYLLWLNIFRHLKFGFNLHTVFNPANERDSSCGWSTRSEFQCRVNTYIYGDNYVLEILFFDFFF